MASSDRGQEVLSSQYGEDVFLVLSSAYVYSSHDGVGSFPICLWSLSLGRLSAKEVHSAGHGKDVFGLFPGLVRPEYLKGETLQLAATFINQFLKVRGDFPIDFHLLGWVNSTDKSWWGRMVGFVLVELRDLLQQVGLYHSVRATQYCLPQSSHNFYGILEHYNPLTGTFLPKPERWGLLS